MRDWKKYWNSFPNEFDGESFFEQVGKTVKRKPISEEQLKEIISGIISNLDLKPEDSVLDLCCGNGLITKSISGYCASITGLDYSERLIEIATKHNGGSNIEYIYGDVNNLEAFLKGKNFSKAYMYEALQHFTPGQFEGLLKNLKKVMGNDFIILVGSIPDKALKWNFYNTIRRKLSCLWKVLKNDEAIGTWWERDFIADVCKKNGLKIRFLSQNKVLHTSHYRFDVCIYS